MVWIPTDGESLFQNRIGLNLFVVSLKDKSYAAWLSLICGFWFPHSGSRFRVLGLPHNTCHGTKLGCRGWWERQRKKAFFLSCPLPTQLILHSHLAVSHTVSICMKMTGLKYATNFYPCKELTNVPCAIFVDNRWDLQPCCGSAIVLAVREW